MRSRSGRIIGSAGLLACTIAGWGWANPALAQDSEIAALDTLIERSSSAESAIALAREQADAGDLLGAAATLERVLIGDEDADDARLAYAAILCRLDDRQSAQLELQTVRGRGGQAARDEAAKACGITTQAPPDKSGLTGEIGLGLTYDGDAQGALRVFPTSFSPSNDGLGLAANARLSGRFGDFYADAWGQAKEELSGPQSDYQYGSLSLGYGTSWSNKELKLGGVIRHARILGDANFTEYGGVAELASFSSAGSRTTVRAEVVWQNDQIGVADGLHYDLVAYHDVKRSEQFSWFLGAGIEAKNAKFASDKYVAGRLLAGFHALLDGRGTYADVSATLRYVDFGDEALFPLRTELRIFNRAAIGTPLGGSGLNIEAAITHSYRNYSSSSLLADYSSIGGALRLIWKFGNRR